MVGTSRDLSVVAARRAPAPALRVVQTIASLAREHGGPSVTVPALCAALAAQGTWTRIVTPAPRGLSSFRGTLRRLKPDVVHTHGVWLPSNHAAAASAHRAGVPLVISPRGMLEPWSLQHHAWKKRAAWWLYQARDLRRAALVHATSTMEADHLRALGVCAPIAVIPNGVALPPARRSEGPARDRERLVLFLSRIHPKKGLLDLVGAWSEVRPIGWRAVIAGPDEGGHCAQVMAAIQAAGLTREFTFVGPVGGEQKAALFAAADLFVLPTHSENFGMVVAEALAHELPVITTTAAPWEELRSARCGWWVEVGATALAAALREATHCSDAERRAAGTRGRALMEARYAWPQVAASMQAAYAWLAAGGEMPECVRHD